MKLLIIHGPNMNLLGTFSKDRLTLDKLNRSIRKLSRDSNLEVKIFQTHDKAKYITLLQRNRNKVDALILNLGPWHMESPIIHHTLSLIDLPYYIVEDSNQSKKYIKDSLFEAKNIIHNTDIKKAYLEGIQKLTTH